MCLFTTRNICKLVSASCLQVAAVDPNGDPLGEAAATNNITKTRDPYYKCAILQKFAAYLVVWSCKNRPLSGSAVPKRF